MRYALALIACVLASFATAQESRISISEQDTQKALAGVSRAMASRRIIGCPVRSRIVLFVFDVDEDRNQQALVSPRFENVSIAEGGQTTVIIRDKGTMVINKNQLTNIENDGEVSTARCSDLTVEFLVALRDISENRQD